MSAGFGLVMLASGSTRVAPCRRPIQLALGFEDPVIAKEVTDWWIDRLKRLARAGSTGFPLFGASFGAGVPVWCRIIAAVTDSFPDCRFWVWTPGLAWSDVAALRGVGFAAVFSSLPWWDGCSGMVRGRTRNSARYRRRHRLAQKCCSDRASPGDSADLVCRVAHFYWHMLHCAAVDWQRHHGADGFRVCIERRHGTRARPRAMARVRCFRRRATSIFQEEVREANVLSGQLTALGNGELRKLTDPEQR